MSEPLMRCGSVPLVSTHVMPLGFPPAIRKSMSRPAACRAARSAAPRSPRASTASSRALMTSRSRGFPRVRASSSARAIFRSTPARPWGRSGLGGVGTSTRSKKRSHFLAKRIWMRKSRRRSRESTPISSTRLARKCQCWRFGRWSSWRIRHHAETSVVQAQSSAIWTASASLMIRSSGCAENERWMNGRRMLGRIEARAANSAERVHTSLPSRVPPRIVALPGCRERPGPSRYWQRTLASAPMDFFTITAHPPTGTGAVPE